MRYWSIGAIFGYGVVASCAIAFAYGRTEHNKQCEALDCDCANLLFPHRFPS